MLSAEVCWFSLFNFVSMDKRYIWIVSVILGVSLLSLIILQSWFFFNARKLKKEQLSLSVNIALNDVTDQLGRMEREASEHFLIRSYQRKVYASPRLQLGGNAQQVVENRFEYKKSMIDFEMLLDLKPISERVDFEGLREVIANALLENNISLNFEYAVKTGGAFDYTSSSYLENAKGKRKYPKLLFPQRISSAISQQSMLLIYFPSEGEFYADTLRFTIPAAVLILILILCSAFTIYIIFRQKKVSKIKNDFINNMTHEFKTPISTISLASQILKDNTLNNTPESIERISGIISEESKRLSFQVEKVLQMAVFEEVEMKLKKRTLSLNDLVEKQVLNFRINVEKQGGVIITHLSKNLNTIEGDEVHLGNLIANLLDNALKYTDETPEITVATTNKNGHVLLSIADNGIGISKDDQKMIFERFYRVHTGNLHNIKGFGLGLSYVKKVVDIHKGNIEIESMLNKGSKFTIMLPARKK